jgi:predicted MPP superfamily phosphohydrolase
MAAMTVPPRLRPLLRTAAVLAVAVGGGAVGWALAPPSTTYVGPLEVQVEVVPSLRSGVHVQLPPVGEVDFDTHDAPVAVNASVRSVDIETAQKLISSPQALLALQVSAPQVLRDATVAAVAHAVGATLAGAALAGLLVYRRPWRALQAGAVAVACLVGLGGLTAAGFDPGALQQPRFTGLLSRAPYVAGEGVSVARKLESYRSGLADFVQSVTALYAVADRVPALDRGGDTTTVLHISDVHLNPLAFDVAQRLVDQFGVDVVVDTGDVTTWGTALESSTLSRIGQLGVPYVFVRGNHDSLATQAAVAAQPNAVVLDSDVVTVGGLTFAGIGDPVFTPAGEEGLGGEPERERVARATEDLARLVAEHDHGSPDDPVDVALVHDPSRLDPLFGQVPLVLAGHYHQRRVRLDSSGTRVMVEGSTGGAGLTAAGLQRLGDGEPLALTATLLHFAASGDRQGELVGYDQVTVGGLGLTSVTIERTVVDQPPARPAPGPSERPSGTTRTSSDVRPAPAPPGG